MKAEMTVINILYNKKLHDEFNNLYVFVKLTFSYNKKLYTEYYS